MTDQFELIMELDKLSELKEVVDPRYIPIVEAKINYRLQQSYRNIEHREIVNPTKKERQYE